MAKGILKKIKIAEDNVNMLISCHSKGGGLYAGGLASEGYNGGYLDALRDVQLLLRGCYPCCKPEFWRESFEE